MPNADLVSGLDGHIKQNKFDELRRKFSRKKLASKSDQLLFSLLYIAIMVDRINEIKMMFRAEDPNSFSEWESVIKDIHPPQFHIHERNIQDKRIQRIFERKRHYKDRFENICTEFNEYKDHVSKVNAQSNETMKSLTNSIQRFSDENRSVQELVVSNSVLETKLNEALEEVESQNEKNKSLQDELQQFRLKQSELVHQLEAITTHKTEDESSLKRLEAECNCRKSRVAALETELEYCKSESSAHKTDLNATKLALQNSRQDLCDFKDILGEFMKKIEAQSCRDHEFDQLQGKLDLYGAKLHSASHENNLLRRKTSALERDISSVKELHLKERRECDEVRSALEKEVELNKHSLDEIATLEAERNKLELELQLSKTQLLQITQQLSGIQDMRNSQFGEEKMSANECDIARTNDAAVLIQSSARARIARAVVEKKLEEVLLREQKDKAAVAIQSSIRMTMAQRRLEEQKTNKVAHDKDAELFVEESPSNANDAAPSNKPIIQDNVETLHIEVIPVEQKERAAMVIQSSVRERMAKERIR
eukprot:CAMPEP_0116028742 /NCGR_PEP_ID=MMETSP0321-20121206/15642_1 /TAXON_ID=163516 /ORGANISM="Leptocylindrus danicus var. danicus, Strain B650" /LENGTH=537 /DNA_ID=CAMNT_0003502819 /DNA_START=242 /DNA_END=1855 /DNA_ORIENTATION=-